MMTQLIFQIYHYYRVGGPQTTKVPLFLMFRFNKETPKDKGTKGTPGVPRKGAIRKAEFRVASWT